MRSDMEKIGTSNENFLNTIEKWLSKLELKNDIDFSTKTNKEVIDGCLKQLLSYSVENKQEDFDFLSNEIMDDKIDEQAINSTLEKYIDDIDKVKELITILRESDNSVYKLICEKLDKSVKLLEIEREMKYTESDDFNNMKIDKKIEFCESLLQIVDNEIDTIDLTIEEIDFNEKIVNLQSKFDRLIEYHKGIDNFALITENIKNLLYYLLYTLSKK